MRHRKAFRKLGRTPSHRRALFRNLATALILNDRVETTLPKAKELRRIVERLVTLAKRDNLHARRKAASYLNPVRRQHRGNAGKLEAVHKLFVELAKRYSSRNGGYTRVVKTGFRAGDRAPMAVIQFVEEGVVPTTVKRKRRVLRRAGDAEAKTEMSGEIEAVDADNADVEPEMGQADSSDQPTPTED